MKEKYLVTSDVDLRYKSGKRVTENDLKLLFESNLYEFIENAGAIKTSNDIDCVKYNIDDLYKFYRNDLTIDYIIRQLKEFGYIIEDYNSNPTIDNESIIHLVVDLKALESCDSYEEYYKATANCYIDTLKAMEQQKIDFGKARDSVCNIIEREILDSLKQTI